MFPFFLLLLFIGQLLGGVTYADDAEVLPQGKFRLREDTYLYFTTDKRYNEKGQAEDIARYFNANLNRGVFPDIKNIESLFRMNSGSGSLGKSVVSFNYDFNLLVFEVDYGLTEAVTMGVKIPYWWAKNTVRARLDTSSATIGKNARLNTLAPFRIPGTVRLTTDDILNILGRGLDINGDGKVDIKGFGYKRLRTWANNGPGDVEAGLRYQYYKSPNWRLALTSGLLFPTGKVRDPDELADFPLGKGTYALLFRLNNDFIGWKNFLFNATFRYDFYFPDRQLTRVPLSVDNPIAPDKETVGRKLGDIFEFEGTAKYQFYKGFFFSFLYRYGFKLKDKISGNRGSFYQSLKDRTDYTEHVYILELSYTTLPLVVEKAFPFPLTVSISYRNRFAGSNYVLQSDYLGLGIKAYF
jgi:hypothetical protein